MLEVSSEQSYTALRLDPKQARLLEQSYKEEETGTEVKILLFSDKGKFIRHRENRSTN